MDFARRTIWSLALLVLSCAAGCEGERPQSVLHPAGPDAQQIATLWWVMFAVYGAAFLLTLALLFFALAAPRREQSQLGPGFIVVAGIVVPTVVFIAMLIYTARLTYTRDDVEPTMRVRVIGHRWWWEVRYPESGIIDANEIHIPVGEVVEFELQSADVIHSFWVPNLAGKMDMLPEHTTTLRLQANRPGVYRGQCAEFCGTQHALMALRVVAHERADMQAWLDRRSAPAAPVAEEAPVAHGRRVYLSAGCADCHRIDGVSVGEAGPDLTHLGSRLTLGAGVFENTPEHLDRWIDNPQSMKRGVFMPPTPLTTEDREALVTYLRSLE